MRTIFARGTNANSLPGGGRFEVLVCLLILAATLGRVGAADVGLMSRNRVMSRPATGNDNSDVPVMTPNGRFVAFCSLASDVLSNTTPRRFKNVLLCDRNADQNSPTRFRLASVNTAGVQANADAKCVRMSASGRYVVFQSDASDLVAGDTNGITVYGIKYPYKATDIFVRDTVTGTTRLVSVAADGGSASDSCVDPIMTPDGASVVFISAAANLVAGDTNFIADVFVRDLISQTTLLVSVGAAWSGTGAYPQMASPAISWDGRFVAFWSNAKGLADGAPDNPSGEIYVRDLQNNTTTWASRNAALIMSTFFGSSAVGTSCHPSISDDGRYVVYKCGYTNSGLPAAIVQYDSSLGVSAVVATNGIAAMLDEDDAFGPEMSPDGQFIVYVKKEDGSSPSEYLPCSSVHVWDVQAGVDILVSGDVSDVVPTNTCSRAPVMSPDGRYVTFLSNATNLVSNAVTNGFHIYIRDLSLNTTRLVDVDTNGIGAADEELACLSMSADGRYVAFSSPDGALVAGDANQASDVFVRDVQSGSTELLSRGDNQVAATGNNYASLSRCSVSADGRWVVYSSPATNLVANDINGVQDVFLWDMIGGVSTVVNLAPDGSPALGGDTANAIISADGRYALFISSATNLVEGVATNCANLYRRDLKSGVTMLVSVSTNGVSPADGECSDPVVSRDGRYVVFASSADNLVPRTSPGFNVFWRDTVSGTTLMLTNLQNSVPFPPSMSLDGRYVAYCYRGTNATGTPLHVYDTKLGKDVAQPQTIVTSAAIDPTGKKVALTWMTGFSVISASSGWPLFSAASPVPIRNSACWSGDGRFLAYVCQSNSNPPQLCLYDSSSNTVTVINTNLGSLGSLSAWLDGPAVSGDGRFVTYRAAASAFPWITNPPPYVFLYDRLTGVNSLLSANLFQSNGVSWVSRPAISGSGATVAFLSLDSTLASPDLNDVQDAFAAAVPIGAALDSDGDGIPDWWMILRFGHATGLAQDLSRALDDADSDGMNTWQEWVAGTVPTDPWDRLVVANPALSAFGATLTWQSVNGITYYVERSSGINGAPFLGIQSNIVGRVGSTSFTDTNAVGVRSYLYRVGVQ